MPTQACTAFDHAVSATIVFLSVRGHATSADAQCWAARSIPDGCACGSTMTRCSAQTLAHPPSAEMLDCMAGIVIALFVSSFRPERKKAIPPRSIVVSNRRDEAQSRMEHEAASAMSSHHPVLEAYRKRSSCLLWPRPSGPAPRFLTTV